MNNRKDKPIWLYLAVMLALIVLSRLYWIFGDDPIGYPCPFAKKMKELIETDLGDKVKLLDYTH